MEFRELHPWKVTPQDAVRIQNELRLLKREDPHVDKVRWIAGADVSYNRFSDIFYAGFVVLDLETLEIVDEATAVRRTDMPYIPGLLTFREGPALLEAWKNLKTRPDAVIFDGQGIAHPRGMGIAAHLGLWLELPSIGCGKSLLVGRYESLGEKRGSVAPLIYREKKVGAALRTKDATQPVYVSVGHLIDLRSALAITLAATGRHRIPEPTRQAHLLVNRVRLAAHDEAA